MNSNLEHNKNTLLQVMRVIKKERKTKWGSRYIGFVQVRSFYTMLEKGFRGRNWKDRCNVVKKMPVE